MLDVVQQLLFENSNKSTVWEKPIKEAIEVCNSKLLFQGLLEPV